MIMTPPSRPVSRLPGSIWALGFVSLLMDTSSELVHSLLPVFMTTVLGASMLTVGWVEGIAEATAAFTKVIAGVLSDRLARRKPLVLLGYGLAALSKPLFPLASSVAAVATARFADRIGKGIRGAPRDALVADITPPALRGAAYGLRQALDSVGAFAGPLLALLALAWWAGDLRAAMWVAVLPAALAFIVLMVGVREAQRAQAAAPTAAAWPTWRDAARLPRRFWFVVALGAVLTLARFSEAFLVLRAQGVGLAVTHVPWVMIAMNVVYAVAAYPAGAWADRVSARRPLAAGLASLIAADAMLAVAATPVVALGGAMLWGLHMALTQGLLAKLVADTAPADLRGTAFGWFNLTSGVALLAASALAGALWQAFGAAVPFIAGAAFAAVALLGLRVVRTPAPIKRG